MKLINRYRSSLGRETFDVLGFSSEEELKQEILKLMKVRTEFVEKTKVNSI